jgi:hypothetical protein
VVAQVLPLVRGRGRTLYKDWKVVASLQVVVSSVGFFFVGKTLRRCILYVVHSTVKLRPCCHFDIGKGMHFQRNAEAVSYSIRVSLVCRVSYYGLDGRGSIPDRGRGFFPLSFAFRPARRLTQPPVQWVSGVLFQGVRSGRGVMLAAHTLLVLRLRTSRSYTSSSPKCLHGVYVNRFTFTYPCLLHYRFSLL